MNLSINYLKKKKIFKKYIMKIICIGRNYAEHALKRIRNEIPENPVIFMKPDTAVLKKGSDFYIPEFSDDVHYELEVVLKNF